MSERKIKFAMVGMGALAFRHLDGVLDNKDVAETVAICDIDEAALKSRGDKYGIPVPQRLKKTDILEYLYWYLGKQNKLTRDLKQTLDAMTITEISNYIKT